VANPREWILERRPGGRQDQARFAALDPAIYAAFDPAIYAAFDPAVYAAFQQARPVFDQPQ